MHWIRVILQKSLFCPSISFYLAEEWRMQNFHKCLESTHVKKQIMTFAFTSTLFMICFRFASVKEMHLESLLKEIQLNSKSLSTHSLTKKRKENIFPFEIVRIGFVFLFIEWILTAQKGKKYFFPVFCEYQSIETLFRETASHTEWLLKATIATDSFLFKYSYVLDIR